MHYFSDLFDKVLYVFWTGPLIIIRSISTLYTQQQVCHASSVGRKPTKLAWQIKEKKSHLVGIYMTSIIFFYLMFFGSYYYC